jgi:hypothetical protein
MTLEDAQSAIFLAFALGMFVGAILTVLCDVWNWWLKKKGWKVLSEPRLRRLRKLSGHRN